MVNRFRHPLILFCSNSWHPCVKSFALWGLSVVTKRIHPHDTKIQKWIQSPHIKLPLKLHWSLVDNNPYLSVRFTFDGFSAPERRETHTERSFLSSQAFLHNDAFSDLGREVRQVSARALMSLSAPRKPGVIVRGGNLKSAGLFISAFPDRSSGTMSRCPLTSCLLAAPLSVHRRHTQSFLGFYLKQIIRHTVSNCSTWMIFLARKLRKTFISQSQEVLSYSLVNGTFTQRERLSGSAWNSYLTGCWYCPPAPGSEQVYSNSIQFQFLFI